ncbi:uncharacterized protein LOC116003475 [Ipomoea triloba]|uniref:uncharacterized protein LOC116003475 n=1 Tax=Ipomoea triloba TaxID=35885 RepID=UPI00125E76D8|nr:uncharacterized protein LOC116003475 [Ipomoea triloba]XP_031099225.1 uncharacterized protein LOC116003475 [Ipomoea triloba]
MTSWFLDNLPWFRPLSKQDVASTTISTTILIQTPKQRAHIDIKFWQWPIFSIIPWVIDARNKFQMPATVNRKFKSSSKFRDRTELVAHNSIRFRPYVSKVPWHTGARGLLSQLFPRYGHYCGPNWSSGKDSGSPIWDRRPIDWLDFCCYCHDIGYDSHDQAELLKADLAFLECLEKPHMTTKGDPHIAALYKTMCISGLRNVLIPYRQQLLKLQSGQLSYQFGWLSGVKWKWPKLQNT